MGNPEAIPGPKRFWEVPNVRVSADSGWMTSNLEVTELLWFADQQAAEG